jgi:hypothetical protein
MWASDDDDYENYCLLGCDTVLAISLFKTDPEDRGCRFNQNVGNYLPDYMAFQEAVIFRT